MDGSWTVSIEDTSSFISYHPHGDGGVGAQWTSTGWQPWFADSGGFISTGGEDGTGSSQHITAFPGASLDFQFYGTSVSIYGTANCSYEVSVDGASSSFMATSGSQLFTQDELPAQMHSVSLTAHASNTSMFAFDRADISRPLLSGSQPPNPQVYRAINATNVQYTGMWTVEDDPNHQIPSKADPAPYYEVAAAPASLSFAFQGVGVAVNGSRNWGSYTYDVTLDGVTSNYNASTMWLIGDALLFYSDGLDSQATHTVNITPKVGGGYKFWLNTITILTNGTSGGILSNSTSSTSSLTSSSPTAGATSPASPPTSGNSKHTNGGAIAGGIVGGIAALVLLGGLLAWRCLRKRRAHAFPRNPESSPFILPPVSEDAQTTSPAMRAVGAGHVLYPNDRKGVSKLAANQGRSTRQPEGATSPSASTSGTQTTVTATASSVVSGQTGSAGSPPTSPPPGLAATEPTTPSGVTDSASDPDPNTLDRLIQVITAHIERAQPPPEYAE
ncbi:hypothetical protein ONZ51_g2287 [Trametes cubensis]|uniref:Transmembrane protein n=1 Tax=Trametes cubensis TaxID=1111947 RepID=A0AAD7XF03_9APHY|nr:hypothetical protein ONZ51_g2287 [Trametes cubensis]